VEYWNRHNRFELGFYFEAVGAFNIFKIDATERWCEALNNFNKIIFVWGVDADICAINTCKLLEKNGLAFHDGLTGKCTDVSETKDCGTI